MNQKLSISLLVGGLATFLMSLSEFIGNHETWQSLSTPASIGHIMLLTATFCMALTGALGTQLPRGARQTRSTDNAKVDINLVEKKSLDCEENV